MSGFGSLRLPPNNTKNYLTILRYVWRRGIAVTLSMALIISTIVLPPSRTEAAITHRATGAAAVANNASTISLTVPSGAVVGDLLVAIIGQSNNTNPTQASWDTQTTCHNTTGAVTGVSVLIKTAVSGDAGTAFSFALGGTTYAAGGIVAYRGVSPTPVNATGVCGTGTSSTAINPGNITTTTADTLVVAGYAQRTTNGNANTIAPGGTTGLTNRVSGQSAVCTGALCTTNTNAASFDFADYMQASATTVTGSTKNATSTQSAPYAAILVAFTPAPLGAVYQSSFRFLNNIDATNSQYIQVDPDSGRDDHIKGTAVDTANGYFYMAGNNRDWLIEKRRIDDGSPDTTFGVNGRVTESIGGSGTESVASLVLDPGDNAFYIAGYTKSGADSEWRIEKRKMSNGNLCTAAECGTAFDTDGIINIDHNSGDNDEVFAMVIDTVNHHIYVGGYDHNATTNSDQWLVGKYNTTNGSVVSGFGSSGYVRSDQSGEDRVKALAVDPSNGYLYMGGYDAVGGDHRWRIEKRKIATGNLCTAAECGTEFGTGGVYINDPTTGTDQALSFQVDTPGNAIYTGGFDSTTANRWRLEKINATTGSLVTDFGNDATCSTAGVVCYSSSGNDQLIDLDLDDFGGYIYTTGQDGSGGTDLQWRIEKRRRTDGTLVTTFGTNGVFNMNPSSFSDAPAWVAVDLPRNLLYTSGGDRSLGSANQQWRILKLDLETGSYWLGAEDTATFVSTENTFRLRMLLHVATNTLLTDQTMKLQYATKVGTCDTSFVNEVYNDVATASGEVRYHDNPSLADAASLVSVSGEPTHGADTTTLQTIEEANNFTPSTFVATGGDGMWDFVLQDISAFGAYCFRVVNSDNSAINAPVVVPEISFCRNDPRTENVLRHGTYFCEGVKRAFFWSRD